jgi:hypothetical protein
MPPKTIPCDNVRTDGAICGEPALIHLVHYIYDMKQEGDETLHVLRGTSYEVDCPSCGRRRQVVQHS